jgi:protein-disulfide isomerase
MMSLKSSLAALAVVAVAGLGAFALMPTKTAQSLLPVGAAEAQATTAEVQAVDVADMTLGNPDAKVKVMEYASFTCPHCANFHSTVFKDLKKDYIDTGKVQFIYREVFFDRYGLWGAMVARCGGEMKYFGVSDILYTTQKEWAGSDDPNVVVGNLKKIGRTAGMDDAQLDACLKDGATAQALINHYEANMKEYDIKGTPTLVINGTIHSNMNYADLKVILDAELAK